MAVRVALATSAFGSDGIVGQPLGLFRFNLGFGFDVERILVVISFLNLRRGGAACAAARPWRLPAYAPVRRGR